MNRIALLLALLAAALLAPAAALAAPVVVNGEFPPAGLGAEPKQLTLGPDGNIWVALSTNVRPLAKVAPDGTVTEYASAGVSFPFGITTGPDGQVWVTQNGGVASFAPSDPARARPFLIPGLTSPRAITTGPDGNLWTASGDKVFRIPPSNPAGATPFRVRDLNANGIARGGDGNLYVASFGGELVRITPAGVATPYPVTGNLQEVAAGPGTQVGFTQQGSNPQYVGLFQDGALAAPALIPGTDPFGITFGLDQAYWVANAIVDSLSRVTPTGEVTTLTGFSARSRPEYLTSGVGGTTLWVSLKDARRIARVTGLEAPPLPPVTPPTNPSPPTTPPPTTTPPPAGPAPGQRPVFRTFSLTRTTTYGRSASLSVSVADASTVTIVLALKATGRRNRAGTCVRPSRSNRSGRSCVRYVTRATAEAPVRSGAIRASFSRRLGVGSYRVTLSATNAIGTTRATRTLTVKPQPRPRRAAARGRARARR